MNSRLLLSLLVLATTATYAQKTYPHASRYQVGVLDENVAVTTGTDVTLGKTSTDAKLGRGGQGFHFIHTDDGNYRVEAPVNKGMSILVAMATPTYQQAPTVHNQWFLDKVAAGTNVLFAAECSKAGKKHPNDTVRCEFWFPDPDSDSHEYRTMGDFTPYLKGDGSNIQKAANVLCGTGKLNPATEEKLCGAKVAEVQPPAATDAPIAPPTGATPTAAPSAPSEAQQETDNPERSQHGTLQQIGIRGTANTYGIFVNEVSPGSVAERGGIHRGDTIAAINNNPLRTLKDADAALARSGERISFGVIPATAMNDTPQQLVIDAR